MTRRFSRAAVVVGLMAGCVGLATGVAAADDHGNDGRDGQDGEARARCEWGWLGFTPHQCKARGGGVSDQGSSDY